MFRQILDNLRNKKQVYNSMVTEDKARMKLEDRKLTAEEKAFNKYIESDRQKMMREYVKKRHEQEDHEYWHKDTVSQPYIFKDRNEIMRQKNLFRNGKKIFFVRSR